MNYLISQDNNRAINISSIDSLEIEGDEIIAYVHDSAFDSAVNLYSKGTSKADGNMDDIFKNLVLCLSKCRKDTEHVIEMHKLAVNPEKYAKNMKG